MTPEQRRIRGNDARQLLDNKLLKEAFNAVNGYVDSQAMSCSPDDKDRAQRIIITKQLLQAVKREIERMVEDGTVADIQIQEIEKRRGVRMFRR